MNIRNNPSKNISLFSYVSHFQTDILFCFSIFFFSYCAYTIIFILYIIYLFEKLLPLLLSHMYRTYIQYLNAE